MIELFFSFYDRFRAIILSLSELTGILLTIYFFIKYKRNSYQQLNLAYNASGFLLLSIGGLFYVLRFFLKPIINNIDNNIIYSYMLPLIIGLVGFVLVTIGGYKERRK